MINNLPQLFLEIHESLRDRVKDGTQQKTPNQRTPDSQTPLEIHNKPSWIWKIKHLWSSNGRASRRHDARAPAPADSSNFWVVGLPTDWQQNGEIHVPRSMKNSYTLNTTPRGAAWSRPSNHCALGKSSFCILCWRWRCCSHLCLSLRTDPQPEPPRYPHALHAWSASKHVDHGPATSDTKAFGTNSALELMAIHVGQL